MKSTLLFVLRVMLSVTLYHTTAIAQDTKAEDTKVKETSVAEVYAERFNELTRLGLISTPEYIAKANEILEQARAEYPANQTVTINKRNKIVRQTELSAKFVNLGLENVGRSTLSAQREILLSLSRIYTDDLNELSEIYNVIGTEDTHILANLVKLKAQINGMIVVRGRLDRTREEVENDLSVASQDKNKTASTANFKTAEQLDAAHLEKTVSALKTHLEVVSKTVTAKLVEPIIKDINGI